MKHVSSPSLKKGLCSGDFCGWRLGILPRDVPPVIPSSFVNKKHPAIISPRARKRWDREERLVESRSDMGHQNRMMNGGRERGSRQPLQERRKTEPGESCECEKKLLYNRACYYSTSTKGGRAQKSLPVLGLQSRGSSPVS